ncbi:hypothetical protein JVU11DRAFT_9444 [Chiua virens]|nr:hypothetical protein JVU11DRAFT_9444 [Chiua virens]
MMGLFSQAGSHIRRARGLSVEDRAPEDTEPDDTSILDENEGSVITSLISQLRVGMDLSKVTFPTFVLEPRSMLERITDFMSHPDVIFGAEDCVEPEERYLRVLQYYLAGWHIKPKGVKKPYNPVLGEFFRLSHHPPISAFFYISPENGLCIVGELRPKSRFMGNSVAMTMEGENRISLLGKPEDGEYVLTMPNMYARGILFGKMVVELGDTCIVKNETHRLSCDLEFKTKVVPLFFPMCTHSHSRQGFFSGTYNAIVGRVRKVGYDIGEISGRWSHVMEFKGTPVPGTKRVLFDVAKDGQNIAPKYVAPEDEQEPYESRRYVIPRRIVRAVIERVLCRLWQKLTEAIVAKDMEAATRAKTAVEDAQRDLRRRRDENGEVFVPRFFELRKGRWCPKLSIPQDASDTAIETVESWIWASA